MRSPFAKLMVSVSFVSLLCACSTTYTANRVTNETMINSSNESTRLGTSKTDGAMQLHTNLQPLYRLIPILAKCAFSASAASSQNNQGAAAANEGSDCPIYKSFDIPYKEYKEFFNADATLKETHEIEINLNVSYLLGYSSKDRMEILEKQTNKILSYVKSNPEYEPILDNLKKTLERARTTELPMPYQGYTAIAPLQHIDANFDTINGVTYDQFMSLITMNNARVVDGISIGFYKSVRNADGSLQNEFRRKVKDIYDIVGKDEFKNMKYIAME